jgi:hypothetical protein
MNSNYTHNLQISKYMKKTKIYQHIEINLNMYRGEDNSFIENGKSG